MLKERLMTHIAVMLYGFTAIIGKLITINAVMTVWWRMLFTILGFFIWQFWFIKSTNNIFTKANLRYIYVGFIICLHWYCFYGSVKVSHASLALVCMSLTLVFTAIIDPLINKNKFRILDLCIACIIVPLIFWMVDGIKNFSKWGLILGVLAAFLASLFSIINKNLMSSNTNDPILVTLIEMVGVFILSTPLAIYFFSKDGMSLHSPTHISDILLILCLAWLCTNVAFVLSMYALQKISVFEANLIIGLEPIYGIILAIFILKEDQYLTTNFYLASACIFILTIGHQYLNRSKS